MDEKNNQFSLLQEIARELSGVFDMQKKYEALLDEHSDLENENHEILRRMNDLQQTNQMLSEKIQMLKDENFHLKIELSDLQENFSHFSEMQDELSGYRENYLLLEKAYQLYKSLPDTVQARYASVVDASSPLTFLVSGSDAENIGLYYETICMEWEKYEETVLEKLNQVFDFLFAQFRVNHPDYARIHTNTGDAFRLEEHIRTADSPPVGNISKIIIAGFGNGNKLKKSFVKLG